jgi:hypothetical protein
MLNAVLAALHGHGGVIDLCLSHLVRCDVERRMMIDEREAGLGVSSSYMPPGPCLSTDSFPFQNTE